MRDLILAELEDGIRLRRWMAEELTGLIEKAGQYWIAALAAGQTIFFCGNGGSAGDSQHLAAELTGRLRQDRAPLAAVALTTDTSVLTAIANDYGYEHVFARQIAALGRPGDVLCALSTSGRSPNILAAVAMARERGLVTIGFAGGDGGPLAQAVDLALVVPSRDTARIQEAHLTLGHILCALVECWVLERDAARTA
jgi:D-sedoheptulose 7-phosphate isomerase